MGSFDGVHAGDAAGEGIGRGRGALSEERLLASAAVRTLAELDLVMPGGASRLLIAIGQFVVGERLVEE